MNYKETVAKIKSLEIQGAARIAKAAVDSFGYELENNQDYSYLKMVANELKEARETEPALRNALNYCLANYKNEDVIAFVGDYWKSSKEKIAEIGSKKVMDGMTVFTHCHSTTVEGILFKAKDNGVKFEVVNTETRPRFQGRLTAELYAKAGIPITHAVDSAGTDLMDRADLFLFGADAVTAEGKVVNKIGTEFLLDHACKRGVDSFSCTNSWKMDPMTKDGSEEPIEQRDPSEVWENPPKGVTIYNPAFEPVLPDKMTGIITELGVVKPETLILEVERAYPWIFEDNVES